MANSQGSESKLEEIISRLKDIEGDVSGHITDKPLEKIPLIDPTANVLSLVAAAMQRQDDLRELESAHIKEIRDIKDRNTVETADLRKEIFVAESKRIDAVNASERLRVDAGMASAKSEVSLAAQKQEQTAAALAERVENSAKTLAADVEKSAKTLATTVQATTDSLKGEISVLRTDVSALKENQYRLGGGAAVLETRRTESLQESEWGRQSRQSTLGIWVAVALCLFATAVSAMVSIGIVLWTVSRK